MPQEIELPQLTEEAAVRRLVKWLTTSREQFSRRVNSPNYGHELYIPDVILQCYHDLIDENKKRSPVVGPRQYSMNVESPKAAVFYNAAWVLVHKRILRPNPPNPHANGADINKGFTVTSYGRKWLSRVKDEESLLTDLLHSQDESISADTGIAEGTSPSSLPTRLLNSDRGAADSHADVNLSLPNINAEPLLNNRYRILTPFPSSGFGQTFLAEDTFLPSRRKCVIKQFTFSSNNPDTNRVILGRFEREAAILEKLAKSNQQIPDCYAYFSEQGQFYLVQEWIEGETLAAKVAGSGTFDETDVKKLVRSILKILAYVHSHSMIHRDIKPENIILSEKDARPYLIDFGAVKEIAKTVVDTFGNPSTTIVVGTPGFIPPEQSAGLPVFASDLYCLGLTAIYMLTAKRPPELIDLRTGNIAWHEHAKDVSPGFSAILDKAINPNFRERFPEAKDMLAALDVTSHDTPLQAKHDALKPKPVQEKGASNATQSAASEAAPPITTEVAVWLLKDFLNGIIKSLDVIRTRFNRDGFVISASHIQPYNDVLVYRIDFFNRQTWDELLTSSAGEFFLDTFPSINNQLSSYGKKMDDFDNSLAALEKTIEASPVLLRYLIDLYEKKMERERIPRSQFENSSLMDIASLWLGELHLRISNYKAESTEFLVRFTAYTLLGLKMEFPVHAMRDDEVILNFCTDVAQNLHDDTSVAKSVERTMLLYEVIKSESADLFGQLKKARLAMSTRYNAPF